jgi:hypothetical protein
MHAFSLKERGGRMRVPFFWRTLPMLLPAVAANVKQIDSHISFALTLSVKFWKAGKLKDLFFSCFKVVLSNKYLFFLSFYGGIEFWFVSLFSGTFGNAAAAVFLKNLKIFFLLLKFNMICMVWIVLMYWCQK